MASTSTPVTPAAASFFLPGNDTGCLVIHGYGGSIGDYRLFSEALHEHGLTVHGVRLAGHGQGKDALRQVTIVDWQASVEAGWKRLREHCRRVVVIGSSFGGVLALDLARRQPLGIDGLVLINTALSYSGAGVLQGTILRLLRLVTPYYPKRGLTPAERIRGQQVGSVDAWPINGILATAAFARRVIVPALPQITVPALVLTSSYDPVVSGRNGQLLIQRLGSSQKSNAHIPVQTHRPFRDPAAVRFMVDQVVRFVQTGLVSK